MLAAVVVTAATIVAAHAALGAATANPCALVKPADAAKALAGSVGTGKLQSLGLYKSCTYNAGRKTLTVQTRPLTKADFVKSAKANPGPVVRIAGLGGEAYSVAGGASLLTWKKGTEVTFLIIGLAKPLAAEKLVAKAALARI